MRQIKLQTFLLAYFLITITIHCQTGWTKTQLNLNFVNGYNLYTTGNDLFAGTSAGLYSTTDNGVTWTLKGPTEMNNFSLDVIKSNTHLLTATRFGIYSSVDNGISWINTNFVNTFSQSGKIFAKTSTHLYAIIWALGIFRSADDGLTWQQVYIGQPMIGSQDYAALATSIASIGGRIFIARNSTSPFGIYSSTDNGESWSGSITNSDPSQDQFLCLATDNEKLYAGGFKGVYLSLDYGKTWTTQYQYTTDSHGQVIGLSQFRNIIAYNNYLIAAVDFKSIYISADKGKSWRSFNEGLQLDFTFSSFAIKPPYIFALTKMPADVYRRPLSEITTEIENEASSLPEKYSLKQNYPNPFNPATTISFSVPTRSFITLEIFDGLGRIVSALVSEELSAGTYSRIWNASAFPSGVYFYRLQSASFTETRKLILIK